MAKIQQSPPIAGKKLLPQLAVGCLVFAALMGFGTYYVAVLSTPYLKKRNDEYLRTHRPPDQKAPAAPSGADPMR